MKKGKYTIVLFFTFMAVHVSAQNNDHRLLKQNQLKANINLLGIDLSYEHAMGNQFTAYFEGGLDLAFYLSAHQPTDVAMGYEFASFVSAAARWYYNIEKRHRMGENIKNNAANFLNLKFGYRFSPISYNNMYDTPVFAIEPSWGIQRNLGKHISYELNPGWAFIYDTMNGRWGSNIALNIKIGYMIF